MGYPWAKKCVDFHLSDQYHKLCPLSKKWDFPSILKGARSLNLSNAVAIIAYEAWKKLNFSSADL